jgi:hypothetical protein
MAAASRFEAGPFPWKKQKQSADLKAGYQYNMGVAAERGTRRRKGTGSLYDTGGFRVIQPDQYDERVKVPQLAEMKIYNNRKSYVGIADVDDFMHFNKIMPNEVVGEMADYVKDAFSEEKGRGRYYECKGMPQGHITAIKYNPSKQVMEVTFTNRGNTVLFFRIPNDFYLSFEHYAMSNAMGIGVDGTKRHLVGIRFWDLIRIRGQREGSRYPYIESSAATITAGAEAEGSYTPSYTTGAMRQQELDAIREAANTNTEEPSAADAKTEAEQDIGQKLKEALAGKKYLPVQMERIEKYRDILLDKYGARSPAYREFTTAVEQGWGSVLNVVKLYKLQ